jgi:hypothetical protein
MTTTTGQSSDRATETRNGTRARGAVRKNTQEDETPVPFTTVPDSVAALSDAAATIPPQRAAPGKAELAGRLARLAAAIDAHPTALNRVVKPHGRYGEQHRFTCPQCSGASAAVAYATEKKVTLYCDRKCGATRILESLGLTREALTGRPDLLASVPAHFRRIDVTNEVRAILAVLEAIADGVLPEVYERGGSLVNVSQTTDTVEATDVDEHRLRALLAEHTLTYKEMKDGGRERALPTPTTCSTILARSEWPGVDTLRGVTHTPAVRPDGTIIQVPGFDPATGLYLSKHLTLPRAVPERPTADQVSKAFDLLLNWMLVDFPWASNADQANYLALLLTGVIRPRLTCPTPFGVITAPDRGSGKSYLAETLEILFGGREYAWPQDDTEMRKQITTMLRESTSAVLTFDNVPADRVVEYPSFAGLLTRSDWSDRVLGQSREVKIPNDRIWLATGTNVRLGGDLGQRSVLVSIDPKRPRPDRRTGFKISDYRTWVRENRAHIVMALLILARAWAVDGAERVAYPMRGFTPWAEQVGGILAYHGIDGFMANADEIDVHDEDTETWTRFLGAWHDRYGEEPKRLTDLQPDEDLAWKGDRAEADWLEVYPKTRGKGERPLGRNMLGEALRERKARFYGQYAALESMGGASGNLPMWRVVKYQSEGGQA